MDTDLQGQSSPDLVGQRVGKYLIRRRIGQGGMGTIYEAVHEDIGQTAAIKVLRSDLTADPRSVQRFFTEARAISMVQHPGLVKIFDFNQLPDGTLYMMMELLQGPSLWERYKNLQLCQTWFTLEDVHRILRQLASALSAVHDKGIVHRDLKPENIILVADPESPARERCKLLDFGIAVAAGPAGRLTTANHVLGTPTYMAPEHCEGRQDLDDRADVYSLGVMAYEMLAGMPPFDGDAVSVMRQHLFAQHDPLPDHVPAPLAELIESMLSKERADRPSMEQVVEHLDYLDPWQSYRSGRVVATPLPAFNSGPVSRPDVASTPAPVADPGSGAAARPAPAPPLGALDPGPPSRPSLASRPGVGRSGRSSSPRVTPRSGATPRSGVTPRSALSPRPGMASRPGLPYSSIRSGGSPPWAASDSVPSLPAQQARPPAWRLWGPLLLIGLCAAGVLWARHRPPAGAQLVAVPMTTLSPPAGAAPPQQQPAPLPAPQPPTPAPPEVQASPAPDALPAQRSAAQSIEPQKSAPPVKAGKPARDDEGAGRRVPIFADKHRKGPAWLFGDSKRNE